MDTLGFCGWFTGVYIGKALDPRLLKTKESHKPQNKHLTFLKSSKYRLNIKRPAQHNIFWRTFCLGGKHFEPLFFVIYLTIPPLLGNVAPTRILMLGINRISLEPEKAESLLISPWLSQKGFVIGSMVIGSYGSYIIFATMYATMWVSSVWV